MKIVSQSDKERTVAYRLDGPNGLPTEGYWYANKVGRNWKGGTGLRDLVVTCDRELTMVSASTISDPKSQKIWREPAVTYMGVDAQYFSAVLLPQFDEDKSRDNKFASSCSLCVGKVDPLRTNWTNISFRLEGLPNKIKPGEENAPSRNTNCSPARKSRARGQVRPGRSALLRLVRLGGGADARNLAHVLLGRAQLRPGDHPAHGPRARLHVPVELQANAQHAENGDNPAGSETHQREVQKGRRRPHQGIRNFIASTTSIRSWAAWWC